MVRYTRPGQTTHTHRRPERPPAPTSTGTMESFLSASSMSVAVRTPATRARPAFLRASYSFARGLCFVTISSSFRSGPKGPRSRSALVVQHRRQQKFPVPPCWQAASSCASRWSATHTDHRGKNSRVRPPAMRKTPSLKRESAPATSFMYSWYKHRFRCLYTALLRPDSSIVKGRTGAKPMHTLASICGDLRTDGDGHCGQSRCTQMIRPPHETLPTWLVMVDLKTLVVTTTGFSDLFPLLETTVPSR